ncbi:uncharacterized protein [Clytia hemisphaerica]|uniref:uncharacterized protein n=1 Tax=Clytia hemisphaerica TaxID=252671 RepID=UPI0034D5BF7C
MAELHWAPLKQFLAKYISSTCEITYDNILNKLNTDMHYLRRTVLQNLHIATLYFETRTINYYNTVAKELFNLTDYWFRFEFAKSRGQIHSHGLIFSETQAKNIEQALDIDGLSSDQEKAETLYKWLQTHEEDTDTIFSPGFVSMHPAGGFQENGQDGSKVWIPNKEKWAKPEGTQEPPEINPLNLIMTEYCTTPEKVKKLYLYLVNRVALHNCNDYCLKRKRVDSDTRYCRFHFGKEDPITKKTPGKELHPFAPILTGDKHPRYEGPRDHCRIIMNVKAHLLSWLANCDTRALVDQDLLNLQKYITSYACKGAAATQDLVTIYGHLLDSADPNASVKSIVLRLLNRILGKIDTPAACCDFINSGSKLWHCTRKFQSVGLSGYRPLSSKPDGENFTQKIAIDKFLSNERREKNPTMTLYDWVRECSCRTKCTADHCPVFTGIQVNPVWPLSENYCKGKLMMFSPGVWTKPEDLKLEGETFGEAFARFFDTEQCPRVVKDNVKSAKKRYDEKMERERKRRHKLNEQHNDYANQESQADSQYSFSSSTFSQDFQMREVNVAHELLNEIHDANPSNAVDEELEVPLLDGGPDFDWYEYAMQCLGQAWPDNVGSWLDDMDAEVEKQTVNSYGRCDLPRINLLLANELQRLIIAINLERMILLQKGENYEPLRLLVQGTAGTVVNFFGDLGQLGPVKKLDLHLRPAKNASPDELAGFAIYRNFQDVIVLNQTMRQKECEKMFLERLLRIRGGRITQQDWLAVNARYEKELPEAEKINYCNAEITITLHETWREVNKENRKNLANLNVPVATIPSTGRGYHHKNGDKQVGQIPPKATIAVNSKVILTKNQKAFTPYGLHNGAAGIVKAILYEKGTSPPQLPTAVIVYFPRYTGPAWDINNPKFIPITAVRSKCESECCSRTGLPLIPGYSLPIAKAQGITVGSNQPAEFMRVSIQEGKYMEQQSLGITYTALSRAESEDRWCLIDKIPQDRLHYINNHPQMQNRHQEEKRLNELSANTIARFNQHKDLSMVAPFCYVAFDLEEFDLRRGDLVLPLCLTSLYNDDEVPVFQVFVPSCCDETVVPSIPLSDMVPIDPLALPEERLTGFSLTVSKGNKYVSVKSGHGLQIGDYLVIRGHNYKITDVHPDDGSAAGAENSRNVIYVDKPFKNNVNNQAFRYRKMVYVNGRIESVGMTALHTYRGMSIRFNENKNENLHGNMEVIFRCAVFNSSGFFTKNLAIAEVDM